MNLLNRIFNRKHAPSSNAMMIIFAKRKHGTWIFTDTDRGLVNEPFVAGIPEMIDKVIELKGWIRDMARFTFSGNEFPGYDVSIIKVRDEHGGAWYKIDISNVGQIDLPNGWLCPATLKFFNYMPDVIYIQIS